MFLSPSGNGIKVVIKHNLKEPTLWKYLFNELEAYYLDKYNIVLDKSGKDINRMCFLPYIEKKTSIITIIVRNGSTQGYLKDKPKHQKICYLK